MLKVLKLQIISDRNLNIKISHKNYAKLSQDKHYENQAQGNLIYPVV